MGSPGPKGNKGVEGDKVSVKSAVPYLAAFAVTYFSMNTRVLGIPRSSW